MYFHQFSEDGAEEDGEDDVRPNPGEFPEDAEFVVAELDAFERAVFVRFGDFGVIARGGDKDALVYFAVAVFKRGVVLAFFAFEGEVDSAIGNLFGVLANNGKPFGNGEGDVAVYGVFHGGGEGKLLPGW